MNRNILDEIEKSVKEKNPLLDFMNPKEEYIFFQAIQRLVPEIKKAAKSNQTVQLRTHNVVATFRLEEVKGEARR